MFAKHSHPTTTVAIDHLLIKPGQTITLYMQINKPDEPYRVMQVEARVRWDGKAELFCDEMQAKPFVAWAVDETEPPTRGEK